MGQEGADEFVLLAGIVQGNEIVAVPIGHGPDIEGLARAEAGEEANGMSAGVMVMRFAFVNGHDVEKPLTIHETHAGGAAVPARIEGFLVAFQFGIPVKGIEESKTMFPAGVGQGFGAVVVLLNPDFHARAL